MKKGQAVEFWSSEHGGCWKRATVDHEIAGSPYIRLRVGEGIYIVRSKDKVREEKPA